MEKVLKKEIFLSDFKYIVFSNGLTLYTHVRLYDFVGTLKPPEHMF